ncbi:neuronal acetylcholine receptor subunit beta-4-like [Glandiceps talaboti]
MAPIWTGGFILFFSATLYVWPVAGEVNMAAEDALLLKLFSRYSKSIRPVMNTNESVPVTLYMTLNQLIDVDEKNQIITTRVWLYQEWNDTRLTWHPSKLYYGLTSIVVPIETLWCPDTALLNSADDHFEGFPRIVVPGLTGTLHPGGQVVQVVPAILRTPCNMDITYFPVDVQHCEIEFGLWMYADHQVQLILPTEGIRLANFIANSEWDISDVRGRTIEKVFSATPDSYTSIIFDLTISRKPLYYTVNLILPCVLVAVLTLVGFALPSDSTDKVNLSISLLLTLYVFSILLAELLPPTSNMIPYITVYLIFNMVLIGISVAMTTCVSILCQKSFGRTSVPKVMKLVFFKYVAKLLFIDVPFVNTVNSPPESDVYNRRSKSNTIGARLENLKLEESNPSSAPKLLDVASAGGRCHTPHDCVSRKPKRHCSEFSMHVHGVKGHQRHMRTAKERKIENNTSRIVKYMEILLHRTIPEEKHIKIQTEWKLLATIIDRLLLVFFTLCTVTGGIAILSSITVF